MPHFQSWSEITEQICMKFVVMKYNLIHCCLNCIRMKHFEFLDIIQTVIFSIAVIVVVSIFLLFVKIQKNRWILYQNEKSNRTAPSTSKQMKLSFCTDLTSLLNFCLAVDLESLSFLQVLWNHLLSRYPEKDWNREKYAWVWHPYFFMRYTPRVTKIPKWKYSICILARKITKPLFSMWIYYISSNFWLHK